MVNLSAQRTRCRVNSKNLLRNILLHSTTRPWTLIFMQYLNLPHERKLIRRFPLVVQWLSNPPFNAGGRFQSMGSIPSQRTKIPHATGATKPPYHNSWTHVLHKRETYAPQLRPDNQTKLYFKSKLISHVVNNLNLTLTGFGVLLYFLKSGNSNNFTEYNVTVK